jgi:ribonuclease P/MRP protein subunit POP1
MSKQIKKSKLKDLRRDMYSSKSNPLLEKLNQSTTQLPSHLFTSDFAQARAHEISHFTDLLQNRPSTKLIRQYLPRTMKRRAMSHNYYRIPFKMRYKSIRENEPNALMQKPAVQQDKAKPWHQKVKRAKTRKHKMHTKQLVKEYSKRSLKSEWMETHIWHAKRCHMGKLWGLSK